MVNIRRLLALLILLLIVGLGLLLWHNLKQRPPEEILSALPKQIDLALDQLHYTQTEEGQKSWTLTADQAQYQRAENLALLENVQLTFYQVGEFGEVELTAKHGSLQQDRQLIEVWDEVTVVTGRDEKLFTERLRYDGTRRLLTTAEPVRLLSPQLELTGVGLQVEIDSGRLLVENDVWMLLLPEENKRTLDD